MKKIMISLLALLLIAGCTETPKYRGNENNPREIVDPEGMRPYLADRLVLVVEEGTTEEQLKKLAARYSMTIRWLLSDTIAVFESELPFSAEDLAAIRDEVAQVDFVKSVEYDYIVSLTDPITPPLEDM